MWYIYTIEYCWPIKENEILSFAGKWMEVNIIMLIRQAQKDKFDPMNDLELKNVTWHDCNGELFGEEPVWEGRGELCGWWGMNINKVHCKYVWNSIIHLKTVKSWGGDRKAG
jgi:hypothetical protein